ncbi:unnamed protein product, partial [Timema podura]|nr:unnamed protein product [Timema podura]
MGSQGVRIVEQQFQNAKNQWPQIPREKSRLQALGSRILGFKRFHNLPNQDLNSVQNSQRSGFFPHLPSATPLDVVVENTTLLPLQPLPYPRYLPRRHHTMLVRVCLMDQKISATDMLIRIYFRIQQLRLYTAAIIYQRELLRSTLLNTERKMPDRYQMITSSPPSYSLSMSADKIDEAETDPLLLNEYFRRDSPRYYKKMPDRYQMITSSPPSYSLSMSADKIDEAETDPLLLNEYFRRDSPRYYK